MAKKYIVDLSEDEVSQLQTLIKKGKHLCVFQPQEARQIVQKRFSLHRHTRKER